MTKLSVLMSARNAEKTIISAVKSALFAMPSNSELLILLDACTDDSLGRVSSIRDKRVRIQVSETRLGINAGRNLLASEAQGEYLGIMDSDDICLPWRFSYSLRKIRHFDAVFGTAIVFGSKLRPFPILPQVPLTLSGESLRLALALSNPLVHSTALLRRSVIASIGGYSDAKSEDYDLWLRMELAGYKMFRTGLPLLCYRFHPLQVSQEANFMKNVMSDKTLSSSLFSLRSQLAKAEFGSPSWNDEIEARLRQRLYSLSPFLKVEHAGLPRFLRKWKNKAISKN